jgi:predicted nucleic acid-binding protein
VDANGLGLPLGEALANVEEFRRRVRLLPEERPLLPALLQLLRTVPAQGKAIHDALVVATMRVHRVAELVTSNPGDFARFSGFIHTRLP